MWKVQNNVRWLYVLAHAHGSIGPEPKLGGSHYESTVCLREQVVLPCCQSLLPCIAEETMRRASPQSLLNHRHPEHLHSVRDFRLSNALLENSRDDIAILHCLKLVLCVVRLQFDVLILHLLAGGHVPHTLGFRVLVLHVVQGGLLRRCSCPPATSGRMA